LQLGSLSNPISYEKQYKVNFFIFNYCYTIPVKSYIIHRCNKKIM
jgi:hypothetical protein